MTRLLVGTLLAGALVTSSSQADLPKVRVRGAARLEGRAEPTKDGVVVQGTLRDDVGAPITSTHVAISFTPTDAPDVPLGLPFPDVCPGSRTAHPPHVAPDEYVVDTDDQGGFCIQTALPRSRVTLKLSFAGGPLYDPTRAEVPVDLSRPPIVLAFDPEPRTISLDEPRFAVGIRLLTGWFPRESARMMVQDEKGRALGTAAVDASGVAHVDIATKNLDGPGPGEIRVTVEGDLPIAVPPLVAAVERRARVQIAPKTATVGGTAEDGIPIDVEARWARGPVPSGSIEARLANRDEIAGAGPVRNGAGRVVVTFAGERRRAALVLRYLPDAPWWQAGPPAEVELLLEPPSRWRRAPWFLLTLAIGGWMLREWWRPSTRRFTRAKPLPQAAAESIPIVRLRSLAPDEGWQGRVVDAHEARPIADAEVAIVQPAFPSARPAPPVSADGVVATTHTDAEGHFRLPQVSLAPGARLHVRATWHTKVEQPCPPAGGELVVAMVSRRRALLDRLVRWSKAELGPWRDRADPTPREVALRAGQRAAEGARATANEVTTWASAVESAAYGPRPIDEEAEHAVASLEPSARK